MSTPFQERESTVKVKPSNAAKKKTSSPQSDGLLATLQLRFEKHGHRHPDIDWKTVEAQLNTKRLAQLAAMEESGGEPDVVRLAGPQRLAFVDCATQSPIGRRSLCYDAKAWQARKEARPSNNVVDVAAAMGVELLTEEEYRALQSVVEVDTTTSSWIVTPASIRAEGGALFCDRRYGHVFVYHNGAQSYYAARGFRAKLAL